MMTICFRGMIIYKFNQNFRLTRELCPCLIHELFPNDNYKTYDKGKGPIITIKVYLNFFVHGSFQKFVGNKQKFSTLLFIKLDTEEQKNLT